MMSNLKLTDREWKEFFIGGEAGIFDIRATKSGIDKNKLNVTVGETPYITRSDIDNGINLFITDKQNSKYEKNKGNVITIGLDTQTVFYQKSDFFTGQNIQVLENKNLNYFVAMFIIPLLKIQMKKFSWGSTGATLGRLNRTKVLLPTNNSGNPDWQFMEDFIRQKEQIQREKLQRYYADKAASLMIGLGCIKDKAWKEFFISEYFSFERGNQNNMAQCVSGEIPLVSAKKIDNGYKDFIAENSKKKFPKHILSLNNDGDGGVGLAYYQPADSYIDTHVTALIPKIEFSKQVMLFFANCISQQREKFSHGYSLNNNRLNAQKILLPTDNSGNPDWQFMHDFMLRIEQNKIAEILEYCCIKNNHLGG